MRYYSVELRLECSYCVQANSEDEAYEKVIDRIPSHYEIVSNHIEIAEEED